MRKAVFTIGEYPKAYIGYTSGKLWNGWATPHFEFDEAKRVAEGFNECAEFPMFYDKENDRFVIFTPIGMPEHLTFKTWDEFIALMDYMKGFEVEQWIGEDVQTAEGIKHLYGIGAYSWVWDETTDIEYLYFAQWIEDFIYEYDTYGYRDVGIDREEMVEAIKTQLKELTVFQQVYEVWKDEDLSEDERFDKLSKLLTV